MSLKLISYNCRSANSNFELIKLLSDECDLIILQETLLTENNHYILGEVNDNFNYAHTPSQRRSDTFVGRSGGGLAILWEKCSNLKIFPIHLSSRIMGLKIDSFIANVLY